MRPRRRGRGQRRGLTSRSPGSGALGMVLAERNAARVEVTWRALALWRPAAGGLGAVRGQAGILPRMPRDDPRAALAFPTRGTPGGWRDAWDVPDDSAELRVRAEAVECRQAAQAQELGRLWRKQIETAKATAGSAYAKGLVHR
jgi:hypothetical protein